MGKGNFTIQRFSCSFNNFAYTRKTLNVDLISEMVMLKTVYGRGNLLF